MAFLDSVFGIVGDAAAKRRQMTSPRPAMPMPTKDDNALADDAAFFAEYRRYFGRIKRVRQTSAEERVAGINFLLGACSDAKLPIAWTACCLGTAKWETADTWLPVREAYWKSESWRQRNLRYYPYYGRGYVQLTWHRNYLILGPKVGHDLVANKDLALDPDIAADIMVVGMREGLFTGKSLQRYLPADREGTLEQFIASRRIINGTDKARQIAVICMRLQACLRAGGWKY